MPRGPRAPPTCTKFGLVHLSLTSAEMHYAHLRAEPRLAALLSNALRRFACSGNARRTRLTPFACAGLAEHGPASLGEGENKRQYATRRFARKVPLAETIGVLPTPFLRCSNDRSRRAGGRLTNLLRNHPFIFSDALKNPWPGDYNFKMY